MRINVETFMALVVMIGAGGAITAAVVTSGSDDVEATPAKAEPEKVVEEKAPAPAPVPVIPPAAKPAVPPAEPTERFTSTILEPIPDDPVEAAEPVVPGPEFEGF
jgi:hypothetical protein